ncbi:MAG TPA: polysaccharide deacetylase family protein, partial [bacterium]|nr:polysaccharide deacetylase family protein [bacterium]
MGESVLALLALPDANSDGWPEVVAATDKGVVTAFQAGGANAGAILWTQTSTCGVNVLSVFQDRNADGYPEVLFAGADQRVHLVSGKTGVHLWNRYLSASGYAYVHVVAASQDLNGDTVFDPVAWTWDGRLWALNGTNGTDLWRVSIDGGFTEGMTCAGDINGDGTPDFLAGGNSMSLKLCSGTNGSVLWTCPLGRPIRDVVVVDDVTGDGVKDGFACTAGGVIACISGAGSGTVTPVWTASIGDVCRMLARPTDCNGDGKPDAVVCGENGEVACFSGSDGAELWRWQGPDVVRAIELVADVDGDAIADIAAACLDGTIALLPNAPSAWGVPKADPSAGKVLEFIPADSSIRMSRSDIPSAVPLEHPGLEPFATEVPSKNLAIAAGATSVPILLYHDVIPEAFYPYGVSLDNFRAQMDLVVQGNYTCVSLDLIADWIAGTAELPENPICITFDGPYEGHHTWAYPILQERGLSAVSYITSDWIGTANHADWHQLREMDAAGIEDVQNHTINHPSLTSLTQEAAIAQLQGCSASLRIHMGKESFHHAYPGGSYNSSVMQILRTLGFKTATTVVQRHVVRTDDPMALPRYSVLVNTTIAEFKTKIRYAEITPTPLPEKTLPYQFVSNVGSGWTAPSYADVDAEGKLWVCDYNAKQVRVFSSSGVEMGFSPITQGLNQSGVVVPMEAPSGVAVTPSGDVLISICDYFGSPQYLGLFRYRASDGQVLNGWDINYKIGDVDCDANGLIYTVNKVGGDWHVYTSNMTEVAGSPFGTYVSSNISRGISVRPDSTRVYIISETD